MHSAALCAAGKLCRSFRCIMYGCFWPSFWEILLRIFCVFRSTHRQIVGVAVRLNVFLNAHDRKLKTYAYSTNRHVK
jgi:hypothetical protein